MNYKYFNVEKKERVALVTIHNPPMNFLRWGMLFELNSMFDQFAEDDSIGAIVLAGGVKGYFIAHADMENLVKGNPPYNYDQRATEGYKVFHETLNKIQWSPKLVIAAINGQALGGGLELALACDIRFQAKSSTVGLIEINSGVFPSAGGSTRLPRLIGIGKSLPLILEGRIMGAKEAKELGIVHKVVDDKKLLDYSIGYGQFIAEKHPGAVKAIKYASYTGLEQGFKAGLSAEHESIFELVKTERTQKIMDAAISAYAAGQKPDFYRLGMQRHWSA